MAEKKQQQEKETSETKNEASKPNFEVVTKTEEKVEDKLEEVASLVSDYYYF